MKPEILLLVPTLPEIEPFLRQQGKGYGPVVTGIGPYRCAAATQEAIIQRRPDMMILCGHRREISRQRAGGRRCRARRKRAGGGHGFLRRKGVRSEVFRTVRLSAYSGRCSVAGRRLEQRERSASPHVDRSAAQIENMEGAAFFDVCLRERIPFWELRAISNTVGEPFGQWNIPLATDALARAIGRLLQTAENTYRTARPSDDT